MAFVKTAIRTLLSLPNVPNAFRFLIRDSAVIFMLHRFAGPDPEVGSPASLRNALGYLRREQYKLLPLSTIFHRLAEGGTVGRTIVFTVDDGYRDLALIAPTFAEFDCPVTVFLTTGFIDGLVWMWWDRIAYIVRKTTKTSLEIIIGPTPVRYSLADPAVKEQVVQDLVSRCKRLPEEEKLSVITSLASAAEVELPANPPDDYAPLTWEDVRRLERNGMEFGPHSVTHPILSRISDDQSMFEIRESWSRLKAETSRPAPIFCYPNGELGDFGPREFENLTSLQFHGAVTCRGGYASPSAFHSMKNARFQVPRFGMPEQLLDLKQRVFGVEKAKLLLRKL